MVYVGSYCVEDAFFAASEILLLNHIRIVHSCDPNFSIQCLSEGCSRTFNNFKMFQNHCHMCRAGPSNGPVFSDHDGHSDGHSDAASIVSAEESVTTNISADELQSFSAKWILKTSETRSLTRAGTLGIVNDVSDMLGFMSDILKEQIHKVLHQNGVDDSIIREVGGLFHGLLVRPFENLTSFHQQLQYYRDHLGFIVSTNHKCVHPCMSQQNYKALFNMNAACMHRNQDELY